MPGARGGEMKYGSRRYREGATWGLRPGIELVSRNGGRFNSTFWGAVFFMATLAALVVTIWRV